MIINTLVDVLATLSFYKMSNSCRIRHEDKNNQWNSIIEGVTVDDAFNEVKNFLHNLNVKNCLHGMELCNLPTAKSEDFNKSFKEKISSNASIRCVAHESFLADNEKTPLLQFARGHNKFSFKWNCDDLIKNALKNLLSNEFIKQPPLPNDKFDKNFKGYETYASGMCACDGEMPLDFPFKVLLVWIAMELFPVYSRNKKNVVDGMKDKKSIVFPVNSKFMNKYEYFQMTRLPMLKEKFVDNKIFMRSQGIVDLFCFERFIKNKSEFFQKI